MLEINWKIYEKKVEVGVNQATCQTKDIIWDTVNNRICFDIKPNSIGVNQRIVVAKNAAGRIEMHIQNAVLGQTSAAVR